MPKKFAAEFVGTFTLVLFGCGAVVLAGFDVVGQTGIAWAFGLAIVAMAYGIGPISGCHVNPAVSFGAWVAGRMTPGEMFGYWVAQCLGAIIGAGVVYLIASGSPDYTIAAGLGQNGYGAGSPGGYGLVACAVFEVVATFIFLVVILGVTQKPATAQVAGLARCCTLDVERAAKSLKHARRPRIHTFIATSPIHLKYKLRKTQDQVLEEAGIKEDELKRIDADIRKVVSEAADFAESSPEPEAGELYTDVLVEQY